MNNRTITHNSQIDQLITTLTPKSAPVPLVSTWGQLHENAIETMKIANEQCLPNENNTPNEFIDGFLMMVMILFCFFVTIKLKIK